MRPSAAAFDGVPANGPRSGFAARLQFAFTISFHIIFPSFTIGLAAYLATLEVLWGWTGAERYKRLASVFLAAIFNMPGGERCSDAT